MRPLLLDFGGVVLLTPFELRESASRTLGPLSWAGPFDVASDPLWAQFQDGAITERQYWARRADEHGLDTEGFMRHFYEPPGTHLVRPEMWAIIRAQHAAGGIVGMLTNDLLAFHGSSWMTQVGVIAEFDFIVDGSVTGVLKPDPRAFQIALGELGWPDPAQVVFVDDQPINLEGARASGLATVWFDPTDVVASIARVERHLATTSSSSSTSP